MVASSQCVLRRCVSSTKLFLSWCTKRIVSLSLLALILTVYVAFWQDPFTSAKRRHSIGDDGKSGTAFPSDRHFPGSVHDHGSNKSAFGLARFAILIYSIFVHILAALYPIRACLALKGVTEQLKKREDAQGDEDEAALLPIQNIRHIILLPNYKEDIQTLRQTLAVLASHYQARSCYEVILAMEGAEPQSDTKAQTLIGEYRDRFLNIDYTIHPVGIPGEARGKSSNLAWAAQSVCKARAQLAISSSDVIMTVMDADSYLAADHFALISAMHASASPEDANATIYVPPIVFDRNANSVPRLIRVADIVWCTAGLSGFLTSDRIRPPTSVYSLPLRLVEQVGGWDAGPEAIGEDLHMYLKCYWALKGNLIAKTVPSPASHTDIEAPRSNSPAKDWYLSHRSRYNQAIRHMWGSLDTGYALQMLFEGFFAPHCDSSSDSETQAEEKSSTPASIEVDRTLRPNYRNHCLLFLRLFEAHMLPVHLIILGLNSTIYKSTTSVEDLALELEWEFRLCGYLRAVGLLGMCCVLALYKQYREVSVRLRERDTTRSGMTMEVQLPSLSQHFLDVIVFPVAGTIFGSIPAIHAQIRQLWSVELAYTVSFKPDFQASSLKERKEVVKGA